MKNQRFPVLTQQLAKTSLGVLVGMGVTACLLPQPTFAQVGTIQPSADLQDQQNNDPFSRANDGGCLGVFDLIHRAQMGNLRSVDEFTSEQRQNLTDASADFRRQQLERLRQLNELESVQPVNPPAAK